MEKMCHTEKQCLHCTTLGSRYLLWDCFIRIKCCLFFFLSEVKLIPSFHHHQCAAFVLHWNAINIQITAVFRGCVWAIRDAEKYLKCREASLFVQRNAFWRSGSPHCWKFTSWRFSELWQIILKLETGFCYLLGNKNKKFDVIFG